MNRGAERGARRRRERLLKHLRKAERARVGGRITDIDYAAIALSVFAQLNERVPGQRLDRFEGTTWEVFVLRRQAEDMLEGLKDRQSLGRFSDSALALCQSHKDFGAYRPGRDLAIQWTPALTDLVRDANRRLSRSDRILRPVEEGLARFRHNYPLVFGAVGAVLLALIAGVAGYVFGSRGP